jgi:ferredoxin
MKQPVVNQDICIGCGTCIALASNTFAIDPATGKAEVTNPTGNTEAEIDVAIASCPGAAITWTE